jgi:hypothetical protein
VKTSGKSSLCRFPRFMKNSKIPCILSCDALELVSVYPKRWLCLVANHNPYVQSLDNLKYQGKIGL